MNVISQIQRDIKFQELVVPGHGPGILTSCPESGGSVQCPSQHPIRPRPGLPASSQTHPHGTHPMPAHHSQRNTAVGKGAVNRWQIRTKNTPRLQLQQKNQLQASTTASSPQTGSGYQLQQTNGPFPLAFNTHHISANQQLLVLDPQPAPIPTSTSQSLLLSPGGNLSLHPHNLGRATHLKTQGPIQQSTSHTLYPVLQIKPCVEHHQSSTHPHTYCILEGIPPNPSPPHLTIPCIVPATQTKTNALKSYYNFSSSNLQSVTISNKSHPQAHQFRYHQQQQHQYSAARHQETSSQSQSHSKQQQTFYQTVPHQSQLVVFRPPPREKVKSQAVPAYDFCDSRLCKSITPQSAIQTERTKFSLSSNTPQCQDAENSTHATSCTILQHKLNDSNMNTDNSQSEQQNSNVVFTSEISSSTPKKLDVITSIQSTWLATQPLGNVHLVMGLSAGNALKKQDSTLHAQNTESLPSPIARPIAIMPTSTDSGNTELAPPEDNQSQNPPLHSDSSTSFDFSIEAEKMVSALCNSNPMKELENSYSLCTAENNYEGSELLVRKKSEGHLVTMGRLRKSNEGNELNLSKNSILATREIKHWAATGTAESSDDATSINSVSTSDFHNTVEMANLQSMTECEDERNVNDSSMRLSPSSNSSTSTAKNTKSSRWGNVCFEENFCLRNEITEPPRASESNNSTRKLRNTSCQTDISEGMYDEQLMFRKTTMKGCYEISKIIEEYMSPCLDGLNQFCVEVQQAVSKPETLITESIQKDLIVGFLRLANCWANLYPCLGVSQYTVNNLERVGVEVTQLFQNWTCSSRKLMEGLIEIFERQINEYSNGNTLNKEAANMAQVDTNSSIGFNNQGFIGHNEYAFTVTQDGYPNNCPSTTALTDTYSIIAAERNDSPLVLTSIPQNVIPCYPVTPMHDVRSHTINHNHIQNNLANVHTNHKPNWRLRRFTDTQPENTGSRNQSGTRKGKGSLQLPKDNSKRWNMASSGSAASFHSTYTNPKYSETPRGNPRKPDDAGTFSSRASRSESQVTHDRFNRHHIGNRFKQKMNTSGKRSLNMEAHLRDRALETLELSKHWQQQQSEASHINQKSPDHELYARKMSMEEITSVPKNKTRPLGQTETCPTTQSSSRHVDLSSWFQNPMSVDTPQLSLQNPPEVLYSDRSAIIEPTVHPNQEDISLPSTTVITSHQSARRHSYQDSRNQLIAGRGRTWSNKRNNNYVSKPAVTCSTMSHTNMLMSHQCDEHDSSDDLQDRVYMKPGSYDVPKRRPPIINNHNTAPMIINSNVSSPLRPSSPAGVVVPFPAAPIVPSPSQSTEKCSSIFRHILMSKPQDNLALSTPLVSRSNNPSDTSDIAWKAACASAETLLETLQGSNRSPKFSNEGNLETEEQKMTEEECAENKGSESVSNTDKSQREADGKAKEKYYKKSTTTPSQPERRKTNIVKTDDWLISTLNNVSKLQGDTETKCKAEEEGAFTPTPIALLKNNNIVSCNSAGETISTENHKGPESGIPPNGQKYNVSKNITSKRKQDGKKDEEQHTPRSRKAVNGPSGKKAHPQHQESGRSNSDSRKRKLPEQSPNEEQQTMQNNNESYTTACAGTSACEQGQAVLPVNNTKPKNDVRNKATWNVWYSSRRRRGLSSLAVNKLEDILNVVWNMEASDFVKYPVSSSDIHDYYKYVKHPMFLETIGYKLKNRIYETIEQFVHDFRRIFVNSKLYNKDNPVYLNLTDILEMKFNSLLEDHFSGWEFGHITGDPNETTNNPVLRYLAFTEKSTSSKSRRAKSSGKTFITAMNSTRPKSTTNSSTQPSSG